MKLIVYIVPYTHQVVIKVKVYIELTPSSHKPNVYIEPYTHQEGRKEGRKEMFYLTTHSTHFIYVIWLRTYGKGPLR